MPDPASATEPLALGVTQPQIKASTLSARNFTGGTERTKAITTLTIATALIESTEEHILNSNSVEIDLEWQRQ